MHRIDDRDWLEEHIDELGDYDGEYIAVVEGRVVAHGPDLRDVTEQARQEGSLAPFRTRIADGKHIDVYEVTGGITILPKNETSR